MLKDGFHVRTATTISKALSGFKDKVTLKKGNLSVVCDSPLNILTLGVARGDEIEVAAEGDFAEEVIKEFDKLVENNFYE